MTGSPRVIVNPLLATNTLREKALAVIFWQPVQWHAIVTIGSEDIDNLTCPQRHPPCKGKVQLVMMRSLRVAGTGRVLGRRTPAHLLR